MRILDIINEQIQTAVKDHNTALKLKTPSIERTERERVLGRGISNIALDNKRDPHTVIRHNSNVDNPSIDSSHGYYGWLVNTKAYNENPYYPRVYEKSTITDKSGKKLIKYEIEKLSPIETLDLTMIRALTHKLFDDITINKILRRRVSSTINPWHDIDDDERALLILFDGLEEVYYGAKSRDVYLNAAMQQAKELSDLNYASGSDLHRGNVMVRFTPHGPQLVLVDPI